MQKGHNCGRDGRKSSSLALTSSWSWDCSNLGWLLPWPAPPLPEPQWHHLCNENIIIFQGFVRNPWELCECGPSSFTLLCCDSPSLLHCVISAMVIFYLLFGLYPSFLARRSAPKKAEAGLSCFPVDSVGEKYFSLLPFQVLWLA